MAGKDHQAGEKGYKDTTLFKKIFENSPIGITLTTPDLQFISVNPPWAAMTRFTKDAMRGRDRIFF